MLTLNSLKFAAFNPKMPWPAMAARSTLREKPVADSGAPRSGRTRCVMRTFPLMAAELQISRPLRGCVAGVPFLALCLIEGDELCAEYIGLEYPVALDLHFLFVPRRRIMGDRQRLQVVSQHLSELRSEIPPKAFA
jgi:hypothetical protein